MQPARSFVVRCWQEGTVPPGEEPVWRFMVEEVGPERRRRGFGSFEGLVTYLGEELVGRGEERAAVADQSGR